MKKTLLALVLIFPLSGCAGIAETALNLPNGILTQSYQNPVTPYMLYEVENGLISVVAGLNVYKRTCWKSVPAGTPAACKNTTRKLQRYTRRLPPLINRAKMFVGKNDQINAKIIYGEIVGIIQNFRNEAAIAGVK